MVTEKLLDMKQNSLRNNYYNTDCNKANLKSNRSDDFQNKKQNQTNKEGEHIKDVKVNPENNTRRNKVVVISNSMVKYLKPSDLASRENFVKVSTQSGAITEDILDYIKPVVRKKLDTVIISTGTNDLSNGVKTMNKVKNLVLYVRENNKDKNIQTGFSSTCCRADRALEKEIINDTNGRLKNYCSDNGFIIVTNSTISESCLNKSKLHWPIFLANWQSYFG